MTPSPNDAFSQYLQEGRFMLQRGRTTGRFHFYPRILEPVTGHADLEWVEADGRGTVYSVTVISPRPPAQPYNVALIDLVEGPRVMSRVDGLAAAAVAIGMPVRARIIQENDAPLLVFEPEDER